MTEGTSKQQLCLEDCLSAPRCRCAAGRPESKLAFTLISLGWGAILELELSENPFRQDANPF